MRMEMYSVWDRKTCVMNPPVVYHNAEQAKRELSMFLDGHRDTTLAKFPDDFALMHVGFWDDNTGLITPVVPAQHVCGLRCLMSRETCDDGTTVIPFGNPSFSAEPAPPSKEAGGADKAR